MLQETKIDYKKRKKTSKRQTIWNYIRRNPNFRVSEVMMVCDVSHSYFQKFIRYLEKAEYVRFTGKKKLPYSNREYRLIKNTGVKAPIATDYGLFDYNTNEAVRLIENQVEHKVYAPNNLINILKGIDADEMTQEELATKAGIKRTALSKWWERLELIGVVKGKVKADLSHVREWERVRYAQYKLKNRKYVFEIDQLRAQTVLNELNNGKYTSTNSDLRHLWIRQ